MTTPTYDPLDRLEKALTNIAQYNTFIIPIIEKTSLQARIAKLEAQNGLNIDSSAQDNVNNRPSIRAPLLPEASAEYKHTGRHPQ